MTFQQGKEYRILAKKLEQYEGSNLRYVEGLLKGAAMFASESYEEEALELAKLAEELAVS